MVHTCRGAFICLEGCDRAGKSTQSKLLVDYIRSLGSSVEQMRFPDRSTAIGKCIDSYLTNKTDLDDHAIHLLFSANRWEAVPTIKNLLNNGTTIVTDRYAYSGVAFTAAKEGFTLEWCKNPDRGLPSPDLVIYLDVSSIKTSERSDYGQERYENNDFQNKVSARYLELKASDWKVIDASKSIEEIHEDIKQAVLKVQERVTDKREPIHKLWVD
ncbi:thymidylate kinase-like isoform X2 [Actinia tenebrosa]|nr:thymidylate kinase-like isoform X2 [Actinia tenebrosa]